jgi:hypothetical protein
MIPKRNVLVFINKLFDEEFDSIQCDNKAAYSSIRAKCFGQLLKVTDISCENGRRVRVSFSKYGALHDVYHIWLDGDGKYITEGENVKNRFFVKPYDDESSYRNEYCCGCYGKSIVMSKIILCSACGRQKLFT